MPSLIDKSRLVHLVFLDPDNRRSWFVTTDRRLDNKIGEWRTWPLVDSDPRQSRPMALEFALIAQRRFREELGVSCRLAIEPNGAFIDEDLPKEESHWKHQDFLVVVTAEGEPIDDFDSPFVYRVLAVHTIRGKEFCWKSDNPLLANQAQFSALSEGPSIAVAKAFERGYTKIEPPIANPHLAARRPEAERQAAAQTTKSNGRLRPGDRPR